MFDPTKIESIKTKIADVLQSELHSENAHESTRFLDTIIYDLNQVNTLESLQNFYSEYHELIDESRFRDPDLVLKTIENYSLSSETKSKDDRDNSMNINEAQEQNNNTLSQEKDSHPVEQEPTIKKTDSSPIKNNEANLVSLSDEIKEKESQEIKRVLQQESLEKADKFIFDVISNNITSALEKAIINLENSILNKISQNILVNSQSIQESLVKINSNIIKEHLNNELNKIVKETVSEEFKLGWRNIDLTTDISKSIDTASIINSISNRVEENIQGIIGKTSTQINKKIEEGVKVKVELTKKQNSLLVISGIISMVTVLLMLFFTLYGYQDIYKGYVNYNRMLETIKELPAQDQQKILDILRSNLNH